MGHFFLFKMLAAGETIWCHAIIVLVVSCSLPPPFYFTPIFCLKIFWLDDDKMQKRHHNFSGTVSCIFILLLIHWLIACLLLILHSLIVWPSKCILPNICIYFSKRVNTSMYDFCEHVYVHLLICTCIHLLALFLCINSCSIINIPIIISVMRSRLSKKAILCNGAFIAYFYKQLHGKQFTFDV